MDADIRHDWTKDEVRALFALPFNDLTFRAQTLHRTYFDAREVQISTLLSIKTGGCPEDCAYCPQASRYGAQGQGPSVYLTDPEGNGVELKGKI